jgi:hypothetical protein
MLTGRVQAESLRIGVEVAVPGLRVTRLGRYDVSGSTVASQPGVWTFLDVEAPDERADELASALAAALRPDDGWYADFSVGDEHVVVFAGHVIRYRKGDATARAQVVAYGLSAGTPRHQLDWAD